jgi:1,5-anhydro-D-fructose reductase (1,5-anhydro-D-mannitol-forming)
MINLGIIGFGKMGRIRYDTVRQGEKGAVVAIADPNLKDPPAGITHYTSADKLINNTKIDGVFICVPNYLNKPLTIQSLKAGKHVFCEKPPAFSARDVEDIMAVEKNSGKKLMYGFNHRHHDSIIRAKQVIDSGVYGRLLWMRGRYGKSVSPDFYSDWRSKKEFAGGGILIDQGIHLLDLFLMMAGDFDQVRAFVSNLYWKLDVEDNVFAILHNRQGVVASLHSTMTQWRHLFSFEIFLELGYITVNGLLTSTGSYGQEVLAIAKNRTPAPAAVWTEEELNTYNVNNSWRYETDQFFDVVERNKPVTTGNSTDALKLMKLIDRIYENPTQRPASDPSASQKIP